MDFIQKQEMSLKEPICLGYSGKLSEEKGIFSFANAVLILKHRNPNLAIKVKLIGWFANKNEEGKFYEMMKEIETEFIYSVPFPKFSKQLQDIHFLFDLRETNSENQRCLPIKFYFYAACGKPIIFSDLKAIRKEHHEINFAHLVDPDDSVGIASVIKNYLDNKELYKQDSKNALEFVEGKYNWLNLKNEFIDFVTRL